MGSQTLRHDRLSLFFTALEIVGSKVRIRHNYILTQPSEKGLVKGVVSGYVHIKNVACNKNGSMCNGSSEEGMISSGRLNLVEITASELFLEDWGSGEEMFMPSAHVESTC
ncbi:unnamed protein product [Rangifer tarandus platyrhynchus]|uniref:Uncharacterized protein n=2 Tax=Rangifer tarandus platyrhynchus TaxID=3082113 RepID=A0ABN8YRW3_RANTA|nr:unnamed protein product [Rangifer tarandus platyrhynchus]